MYRRFVKYCARMATPLTFLTSSTVPKSLHAASPSERKAFEALKRALLSPRVLASPRRRRTFFIDVDACATHEGCILFQNKSLSGTDNAITDLYPVGYFGRALNPAARNYRATERPVPRSGVGPTGAPTIPGGLQIHREVRP